VTGCARSEGYYAISRKEKDVYLDLDLPEQVIREVENVDSSVSMLPIPFPGSVIPSVERCRIRKHLRFPRLKVNAEEIFTFHLILITFALKMRKVMFLSPFICMRVTCITQKVLNRIA